MGKMHKLLRSLRTSYPLTLNYPLNTASLQGATDLRDMDALTVLELRPHPKSNFSTSITSPGFIPSMVFDPMR